MRAIIIEKLDPTTQCNAIFNEQTTPTVANNVFELVQRNILKLKDIKKKRLHFFNVVRSDTLLNRRVTEWLINSLCSNLTTEMVKK